MPAAAPSEVDRRLPPLAWACAAFAGGVLLNVDRVPPWASAVALFIIAWRLTSERAGMRLPGTVARALLALALVAVVLLEFHTVNGLAAGTALLMVMSGLKLLETRARRDQFVMVGTGLSLLLAARLRRPGARGALLARPGTARLRWPHVAAELRRLPPARASAIYREALPLPRGARAHASAVVARPRHARAVPREQREPDVRQSARGRRAGQGAAQLRCRVVPAP